MNEKRLHSLIIVVMLIICSCEGHAGQDAEKLPGVDIPLDEMNSMIEVIPYPGMEETHKIDETLDFTILNRSKDAYSFEKDFGVKIFIRQGSAWKPVDNGWNYPEEEYVLKPGDINPYGLDFFAHPIISDVKVLTTVRVVVIGHIADRPSEKVGAYIDVQYTP